VHKEEETQTHKDAKKKVVKPPMNADACRCSEFTSPRPSGLCAEMTPARLWRARNHSSIQSWTLAMIGDNRRSSAFIGGFSTPSSLRLCVFAFLLLCASVSLLFKAAELVIRE
jgi:hypothetical protein